MAKKQRSPAKPAAAPRWNYVDRQQMSELMGVHPDTVTDNVRAGMPVVRRGGRGTSSQYDAVACLAWQRQQLGKNARENAQTRVYETQAALNTLKLARERGQVVPRDSAILQGKQFSKTVQAKVLGAPRKLSNLGVIPRAQEPAVRGVLKDILKDLADWSPVATVDDMPGPDDE
jgi:phage terminase Nu1 subunit (DNA packaging protein)